jgi:hypothetical protein
MEQVYLSTLFEQRTVSFAMMATGMVATGCPQTTAVPRSLGLNSIRAAAAARELSDRVLAGLNSLSISNNSGTLVLCLRRCQAPRAIVRMTNSIGARAKHIKARVRETDLQSGRAFCRACHKFDLDSVS